MGSGHSSTTPGRWILLDFGDFAVAPGSRRGVLLDDAAEVFARTVAAALTAAVRALVAEDERRRAAALEADLVEKLERAFRDLPREAPEYDFLAVRGRHGIPDASALPGEPMAAAEAGETEESAPAVTLFPPGPLAHVEIVRLLRSGVALDFVVDLLDRPAATAERSRKTFR